MAVGKVKAIVRKAKVRAKVATRKLATRAPARTADPLLSPMHDTERMEVGGVRVDVGRAGAARVKRVIYPAGFRWSVHMKPAVGTDLCMHGHVGFLASGEIRIEYADGCTAQYRAPQIVAIEPGHDGCVVGKKPAVLIELDFAGDTIDRLGMPRWHHHG